MRPKLHLKKIASIFLVGTLLSSTTICHFAWSANTIESMQKKYRQYRLKDLIEGHTDEIIKTQNTCSKAILSLIFTAIAESFPLTASLAWLNSFHSELTWKGALEKSPANIAEKSRQFQNKDDDVNGPTQNALLGSILSVALSLAADGANNLIDSLLGLQPRGAEFSDPAIRSAYSSTQMILDSALLNEDAECRQHSNRLAIIHIEMLTRLTQTQKRNSSATKLPKIEDLIRPKTVLYRGDNPFRDNISHEHEHKEPKDHPSNRVK